MKHWHLRFDEQGIAWLTFDQADAPVNTLSPDTLDELGTVLDGLEAAPPAGLVIRSGKSSGFIAGADVKGFAGLADAEVAEALMRRTHALFYRLERLPCPSVAAIHGFCLGGGLELALACTRRLATDDAATRLGFPEVKLGLFPGFGGSVRSIALLGHLAALDMMLTGRALSGRAAKKIGLVDDCVPLRQLDAAAVALLRSPPARRHPALLQRAAGWPGVRAIVAGRLEKRVAVHADPDHYPAPHALIEHWRRHAGDTESMYDSEARTVARLLTGATAQNLVRVFLLQERLKAQGGRDESAPRHLHVVGAGAMGGDIAAWGVLRGLTVSVQDRSTAHLGRTLGRTREFLEQRLKEPRLVTAALDRLIPDLAGAGAGRADVVLEAIVEDVAAKQAVFRQLEPRLRPDALLATNTSSIPLETLGEGLARPGRLVGLHFFNPVAKMPLLEIVRGPATEDDSVRRALAFARHLDKLPLLVRSSPGFLVNRILLPYLIEAVTLIEEGVAAETVDRAATEFGMPMGPVELADRVGLDICLSVAEKMAATISATIPESLRAHVRSGQLGQKNGQGYYRWQAGHPQREKGGNDFTPEQQDRLMLRLANEAVACLREGIVADADELDAGVVFGTGFAPFRGGPLHDLRQTGVDAALARLDGLRAKFGARFEPDPGWEALKRGFVGDFV